MKVDTTAFVCGIHRARDNGDIDSEAHDVLIRVIYGHASPGPVGRYEIDYATLLRILGDEVDWLHPWSWSNLWGKYLCKSLADGIGVAVHGKVGG